MISEEDADGGEKWRGSIKVDTMEFNGLPLVKLLTKLESTFKAEGMPAKAKGAITSVGNRGNANRKVASACEETSSFRRMHSGDPQTLTKGPANTDDMMGAWRTRPGAWPSRSGSYAIRLVS